MGLLSKGDRPNRPVGAVSTIVDDEWTRRWPILHSYMTQTTWEDGSRRETAGLLVFAQDGMLKGMLRDKDTGLCLWCAACGLLPLLDAMEGLLCDPKADWRVDRQTEGAKASRKTRPS